ncbi:hypothetical protein AB0H73_38865, partial [Streptomyces olivoreticuli]
LQARMSDDESEEIGRKLLPYRTPREHSVIGAHGAIIGTSRHSLSDVKNREPHWMEVDLSGPLPDLTEARIIRGKLVQCKVSPWVDRNQKVFMVTGHGNSTDFDVAREGGGIMVLDGTQLAALLHASDAAYAAFASENSHGAILLQSCSTGARQSEGIAQKLATATGRRVYAPTGESYTGHGTANSRLGWAVFEPGTPRGLPLEPSPWLGVDRRTGLNGTTAAIIGPSPWLDVASRYDLAVSPDELEKIRADLAKPDAPVESTKSIGKRVVVLWRLGRAILRHEIQHLGI